MPVCGGAHTHTPMSTVLCVCTYVPAYMYISAYVYECVNACVHCVCMSIWERDCSRLIVFSYFSVFLHRHLCVTTPICFPIVLCVCVYVCSLYVGHLISPLASCALTSIPSLPFLLSLMGNLAILAWHLAYSLFSCHGYAGLWIAPLLPWPCCECYRCLNY